MTTNVPSSNGSDQSSLLGAVVGGSLSKGVEIKLSQHASVEDVRVGSFVTIVGEKQRFLGLVSDVALASADRDLAASAPDADDPFVAQVLAGTAAYGLVTVMPQLLLPAVAGEGAADLLPAKSIPAHFAPAFRSSGADIAQVFGREDERHFSIGTPLDLEEKVCLDLRRLVERSSAVFGKSGTGKSFLTRLLLVGVIQKTDASVLVFDMHSEYGWSGRATEGGRHEVKGLKQLFPARVAVFTLDEESARRRNISPDGVVRIGYDQVEPEDIALLRETLNLTDLAAQAAFRLPSYVGEDGVRWGDDWLERFLALTPGDLDHVVTALGEHQHTLGALYRRLQILKRFPFIGRFPDDRSLQAILEHLERGHHVVLEFGGFGRSLEAYILVANVLTRRIHDRYVRRVEQALGDPAKEPRPLVIVIEEAHKFLNPQVASQTIFGAIARELRKYNVTLLVIDQRPSAIDQEVMSQIGTKVVCLLDNDKDVDAALAGVSGSRALREVLSRLESKQQALLFGHALPMPIAVRVRDYGTEQSYRELLQPRAAGRGGKGEELFG
ncbi:MAG: ATP-binding protein [Dehalococcoidia bacterium]|nr:ATP-binding protein [Dehalococcoidia bacterium]